MRVIKIISKCKKMLNTDVEQHCYVLLVLIFGVKCDPDMFLTATRDLWESLFSGTCGMSSLFFLFIVVNHCFVFEYRLRVFELPDISCSRITEQICCTTISYCAVQQEFHTHGNVSSHVFGLDLCAYVSEIRTAIRFVLMCGMPVSPCVGFEAF